MCAVLNTENPHKKKKTVLIFNFERVLKQKFGKQKFRAVMANWRPAG